LSAAYFIADYHALTILPRPEEVIDQTYQVAATWLALGLDPARTIFFRQSDVPELFELAWVLACCTSKGWMNKAHAYKARVAENQAAGVEDLDAGINMGLYSYPVLMAADILLFETDLVPVGRDQQQHVEIARDIAQRFNHVYGDVLHLPEALIPEEVAIVPGTDGRKMSKSHGNILPLFAPARQLRKAVMRIVTDSTPPEAPKDPDSSSVFQLYSLLATPAQRDELAARLRQGIGWGDAKQALYELLDDHLREPRARYDELMADRARIDRLLDEGAERARAVARPVMDRVRAATGIGRR
ncbi:MAG TPA: tryptophan--tRNA ligase, partial [Kofleriaceae bacterium]|nr:tryptophan--tRNA ligase [Kofleriaceae bacterium]